MKKILLALICISIGLCFNQSKANFVQPDGGNNGINFYQNSSQYITWDTTRFWRDYVNIYIWNADSSAFTTIATHYPTDSCEYLWNIPSNFPTGNQFRIKVEAVCDDSVNNYEMSYTFFSIYEQSSSSGPLSVSYEIEDKKEIIVYPNPAPLQFRVRWNTDDAQTMRLLSAAGHQITAFSVKGLHDHLFSTECLAPGIYFIEIIFADGNRETTKVVVQK